MKIDSNQMLIFFAYLMVVIIFFLLASYSSGPAYLADEIGYLANAGYIAGYRVDGASSYHAGYSFVISVAFRLFDDPFSIWKTVIAINAVTFSISLYLLSCLLKKLFPEFSIRNRLIAVLFAAIYPSWAVMVGYAFPSILLVCLYVASTLSLTRFEYNRTVSVLPFSFLVGFIYWVHPTGLAILASSIAVVTLYSIMRKCYFHIILHVVVVITLVVFYKFGVHTWIQESLTPEGYLPRLHYPSTEKLLALIQTQEFWEKFILRFFGEFSYALIASMGTIGFAIYMIGKRVVSSTEDKLIFIYLGLSVVAAVAIGCIGGSYGRVDHWIYGRYLDPFIFPLLSIGFLCLTRLDRNLRLIISGVMIIVLITSGFLLNTLDMLGRTNNLMNIVSFWPMYLQSESVYIYWFSLGALAIATVAYFGNYIAIIFLLVSFSLAYNAQTIWHKNILNHHSKPSGLVEYIRDNYQAGTCVGYDDKAIIDKGVERYSYINERFNLYSYYLFNYNYQRISKEKWLSNCDGPILTRDTEPFSLIEGVEVIGREESSGLFIVIKETTNYTAPALPGVYWSKASKDACVISGCFTLNTKELSEHTQVDLYNGGNIKSTNQNGLLFYGPYYPIKKGEYYLKLEGTFSDLEGAVLDIISKGGQDKHLDIPLAKYFNSNEDNIIIPFSLKFDVSDIEIRLRVSSRTKLAVYGYSIDLNDKEFKLPRIIVANSPLIYRGEDTTLSQVGKHNGTGMETDNRAGYLMYGPYKSMQAGEYTLQMTGKIIANASDVVVDVIHNKSAKTYAQFNGLGGDKSSLPSNNILLEEKVTLDEDVSALEIRVYVNKDTDLVVNGYSLRLIDTESKESK